MLSERPNTKGHISYDSTYLFTIIGKSIKTERQLVGKGWGKERMKSDYLMVTGFLFWGDKNILELVRSIQLCECIKTTELYTCVGKFYDMWFLSQFKNSNFKIYMYRWFQIF